MSPTWGTARTPAVPGGPHHPLSVPAPHSAAGTHSTVPRGRLRILLLVLVSVSFPGCCLDVSTLPKCLLHVFKCEGFS